MADITCPLCGPAKTGEICEQEGCPMTSPDNGPVYPDLLERLQDCLSALVESSMMIARRNGGTKPTLRQPWLRDLQTARALLEELNALQALAKGEER